jgi:hypothetical protein
MSFLFWVNPMLPLTLPTFTGLPTDKIAEVDVYTDANPELKNKLASKISAFDTDLGGIIGSATKMVKGIGNQLKASGIDLPAAQQRIKDALGGSRAAISDLAEGVERSIFGDLTGIDEGTGYVRGANTMIDSVKMVYDGATRTFKDGNFKNVSGIVDFIGDLSGNRLIGVFDLGAQAALVKGILGEVSDWGIPQLVDETFGAKWNAEKNTYDYNYDDEFRFSVTKRASDSISPSTSLAVIDRLMEHGGDAALVADNPLFPQTLLAGYVFPEGIHPGGPYPVMIPDPNNPTGPAIPDPSGAQTVPNYVDEARKLVSIMNRLMSGWFEVDRTVATGNPDAPWRVDKVWTFQYINTASDAAKAVLSTDAKYRDALLAAPFYRVESGIGLLKNLYPYFVESSN